MKLIIYDIGISVAFGSLLGICYICLNTLLEPKISKKMMFFYWGMWILIFFFYTLEENIYFLYFRIVYFFVVTLMSSLLIFKGEFWKKIGASIILLLFCLFLDGLTFFSYTAFSIEWIKEVIPIKRYFFYAFTEELLIIGFYKLILDLMASKEIIKKVSLYQNILMLSIITIEIVIINHLIIHSDSINQIRMAIIGISMVIMIAFDCGLIVFLDKIKKNFLLKQTLKMQEQQMEMQEKYYEKVQKQYKETIDLISDMKEKMITLKQYYEDGANEKAKKYATATIEKILNTGLKYGCKDKTLEIVLEDKRQICVDNGVVLIVKDKNLSLSFMNSFDVTTIFTNLLDNAIRAVENIHQPKIEVELLSQEKMLIILVKNPINQKPIRKNGHYLSTKIEKGHGLGLKNVKKAVEKYGGSMDIQIDKGMFVVKILMPMVRGSYENKDKSNKSVQDKN